MSNDLGLLKKQIFEDGRIEEILELLNCWNIETEQRGTLWVAGLEGYNNPRAVQIRDDEGLSSAIRTDNVQGDIYDIVNYIVYDIKDKKESLKNVHKSKWWLCTKLGYPEFIDAFYADTSDNKEDLTLKNNWLKTAKQKKPRVVENKVIDLDYISKYGILPNKQWYDEGLSVKTQCYFEVGFDVFSERVTFPVYNQYGELIGVKGRYIGKNKDIQDRQKYLYLEKCNKSLELFNFHRAKHFANHLRELIIVEGAKSVKFLHQWGVYNAVSLEGDTLSDIQVELLKSLPMDVNYVIAMDKDKSAKEVQEVMELLKGRKKYALLDTKDFLGKPYEINENGEKIINKSSPVDKGEEAWYDLYKKCKYEIL